MTARMAAAPASWVVEVNECRVFGTTAGADWWALYQHVMHARIADITRTADQGQTVTEVVGQPGRVTTGRPAHVEIHNPVTVDPFATIPGAYSDTDSEI